MATTFFTDLFSSMDVVTETISSGMTNLVNVIMPLGLACFTCYLLFIALSYLEGVDLGMMMVDWMRRIFALSIIIGLGLNISTYTSTVFPVVTHLGDDLAQAWIGNTSTNMGSLMDNIMLSVSQITETNLMLAQQASDTAVADPNITTAPATTPTSGAGEGASIIGSLGNLAGDAVGAIFSSSFNSLFNVLFAILQNVFIWIGAIIFMVIATSFLLIAKVLLVILAALGPVFFMFAIFPATRQFFNNWVGQVLSNSALYLLVSIMATIFIDFINKQLTTEIQALGDVATNLTSGNVSGVAQSAGMAAETPFILAAMFVIFGVILLQLPNLASSLFGGLAANGFGSAVNSARNAVSISKVATKAIKGMLGGKGGAIAPEGKGN